MKKLTGAALALCMALSLCVTTTWADATTLPDADANGVITLTEDVELQYEPYEVTGSLTIDLNGHSITGSGCRAINVTKGTLTLTGQGTITVSSIGDDEQSVIRVGGDAAGENPAAIVVGENVTIAGKDCNALSIFTLQSTNTALLKADIYGTLTSTARAALSGNGAVSHEQTEINVYPSAVITSDAYAAIYHPQKGTLNILGGYIEGLTGIEMRAGTLNVTGGTIKGTGSYAVTSNGSGSTTTGAAVAVAEHTTKLGVTVNIKGGTIIDAKGTGKALSVADPQNVSGTGHPVTVNITGGSVNGEVFQPDAFGDAKPTTITGGQFDTDVTAFVPTTTPVATNGDDYYVGGDSIAAAANSGKEMTMVQGGAIDGLEPGATIIVPQGVTGTTLNGNAAEWGYYTIADPNAYQHEPINRQDTSKLPSVTTPAAKADDTARTDTVTSAKTFDAGVAVYAAMGVLSLTGSAWVVGKKRV